MVGAACSGGGAASPTNTSAASSAPAGSSSNSASGTCDPKQIKLVTSIRTLANPYHANWVEGATMYASTVDLPLQVLQDNGDSQTQTSLLRSLVANGGNCIVVNLDPNTNSDVLPQVKLLTDSGAWVVTVSSLALNVDPWTVSDHWIAETAADGRVAGYETAVYLFKAMGGKGNIVALQGILDGLPEQQRFEGLQKALKEYPDIHLLTSQTANWDTQTAYNLVQTWFTKYPGQINGVWSANDSMALGAVEAIRAAGQYGKIPVSGTDAVPQAVQDVAAKDNSIIVTDDQGAYWQGGMGLALGYMAATGKLNVATMSHDLRLSYTAGTVITKDNVAQFLTAPTVDQLKPDWDKPFNRFTGPITFPAS
jgi:ribose transport system substrate-binding protein